MNRCPGIVSILAAAALAVVLACGCGLAWNRPADPQRLPASGQVIRRFGSSTDPVTGLRESHRGVDIAVPQGTMVKACFAGRVLLVTENAALGPCVVIGGAGDLSALYGGLATVAVRQGDEIDRGDTIGTSGFRGQTLEPSIHFGLFRAGVPVDPLGAAAATSAPGPRPGGSREPGRRGAIFDRNGAPLALDTPLFDIGVWKPGTDEAAYRAMATTLGPALGLTPGEVVSRWDRAAGSFFHLRRRAPRAMADEARRLGGDRIGGMRVEEVAGRLYPQGRLASHALGFVGDGNRGLAGIEAALDGALSPRDGMDGDSVTLSLDAGLQAGLEGTAGIALAQTEAEAVIILAGDIASGDLLACVELPDFDPNRSGEASEESLHSRVAGLAWEPGSTFLPISLAIALDQGSMRPDSTYVCEGSGRALHDLMPHGRVCLGSILSDHCLVGSGQAVVSLPDSSMQDGLRAFGFGERTGAGLPGESPGLLSNAETWSRRSKPTIAAGQEIGVTALQMLSAAMALGGGGTRKPLRLVTRAMDPSGMAALEVPAAQARRAVSREAAGTVLKALPRLSAAGRTDAAMEGSADAFAAHWGAGQMIDPATRRYSSTDYSSSAIALVPADSPRVAIYVLIVKPRQTLPGGARETLRAAAGEVFAYLREPPQATPRRFALPSPRKP